MSPEKLVHIIYGNTWLLIRTAALFLNKDWISSLELQFLSFINFWLTLQILGFSLQVFLCFLSLILLTWKNKLFWLYFFSNNDD